MNTQEMKTDHTDPVRTVPIKRWIAREFTPAITVKRTPPIEIWEAHNGIAWQAAGRSQKLAAKGIQNCALPDALPEAAETHSGQFIRNQLTPSMYE